MELKLYTYENAPLDELVSVSISEETPPAPYDVSTDLLNLEPRVAAVFIKPDDEFPLMRAGRILANHGIFNVKLKLSKEISPFDALGFLNALYSGPKKDLRVALPLDEPSLRTLSWIFAMVSSARGIADLGSNECTPVQLMELLGELCRSAAKISGGRCSMRVVTPEDPMFERYSGLRTVGKGSLACMGVIDYLPEGMDDGCPEVALCGKGITFDAGGYDIKPERFMEDMRTDKTGAVNLAAALALAIGLGLKRHVRAYLACARNLVGPDSMVPGDVIGYPDGTTVEIGNTDAEGRLVLADAILQARDDGAKVILDAATLTGSAKYALGRDMCAVFCRDNRMPQSLKDCFSYTGELYWQLPLFNFHDRFLKSRRAALSNCGNGCSVPGASAAAAFLKHFVSDDEQWVHIDLSSAYLPEGSPFMGKGPTGAIIFPVGLWLTGDSLD